MDKLLCIMAVAQLFVNTQRHDKKEIGAGRFCPYWYLSLLSEWQLQVHSALTTFQQQTATFMIYPWYFHGCFGWATSTDIRNWLRRTRLIIQSWLQKSICYFFFCSQVDASDSSLQIDQWSSANDRTFFLSEKMVISSCARNYFWIKRQPFFFEINYLSSKF